MLEARKISGDYCGDYYHEERSVRRSKAKSNKAGMLAVKLIVVGCVLLAVVTGLMLTATHSQVTHRSDKINQIKGEISDLQNANERLKLEIARLKSLDRIELIATTELGMIQPDMDDIEYIAYGDDKEKTPTAEAFEGEKTAAVEVPSEEMVHPIILAVNKMVSNYIFDLRRSGADM